MAGFSAAATCYCSYCLVLHPRVQLLTYHPLQLSQLSFVHHRQRLVSQLTRITFQRAWFLSRPLEPEEGVPVWSIMERHTLSYNFCAVFLSLVHYDGLTSIHQCCLKTNQIQCNTSVWYTGYANMQNMITMTNMYYGVIWTDIYLITLYSFTQQRACLLRKECNIMFNWTCCPWVVHTPRAYLTLPVIL